MGVERAFVGLLLVSSLGLLLGQACALVPTTPAGDAPVRRIDVQGHRGARGLRPENTLPAFEKALALGVSTLELDVGVTRDGRVVVAHDPYVSPAICRHGDGSAIDGERGPLLRDLDLAEVRRYDCGSRSSDPVRFPDPPWEARPGTPIPTLDEVFRFAAGRDAEVRFNVETKLRPGDRETLPAEAFVAAVVAVIEEHALAARVSIQSFDWRALHITRRLAPQVETVGLLARDTLAPDWLAGLDPAEHDGLVALLEAAGCVDTLSPHWRMLLPPAPRGPLSVPALQAAGYPVIPWTVNDEPTMRELLQLGVDGIITDYPDRLLRVLRRERLTPR